MKEISSGLKGNDIPEGVKNLTTRLMIANKNRAHQAEEIQRHIDGSPYPVILCGDFNDTPLSYTYRQLSRKLTDSFIEKGRGIGNTYIGGFPSFRIDYVGGLYPGGYHAFGSLSDQGEDKEGKLIYQKIPKIIWWIWGIILFLQR